MKKAPQTLINIPVVAKKDMRQMPKTTKLIKEAEQTLGTKGRVLVRYSGTENKASVATAEQTVTMRDMMKKKI